MFVRVKKSGTHEYLQLVHNQRLHGRVRQQVIATLGRRDLLQASGQLDALVASCARFAQHTAVLTAHQQGRIPPARTIRIGPPLVFERLWQELGFPRLLQQLLAPRRFAFPLERAIFLTVLHRLFAPGSDRAADRWRHQYALAGVDTLQLHHLYRAMAWLGETLPDEQQAHATPFGPRCTKDLIEEALFAQHRDLFSGLALVFFDTTSLYFEGDGGDTLGQYGHSKDHRPDRKKMVVGAVLDQHGRPICCELWPGNTTDVKTLVPIVERLQHRFGITSLCIVADRGMISRATIQQLQRGDRGVRFILGARLRVVKEIREQVLTDAAPFTPVYGPRQKSTDLAPLAVKEVRIAERRYIVCHNEEQARKDRATRQALVAGLRDKLAGGAKKLIGNKGYRKYVRSVAGGGWEIDDAKVASEARCDGQWVLQTDLEEPAAEVAKHFKELWMVEQLFRSVKSLLATRPIYHHWDETIRGHVFCSFLALVLLKELLARMQTRGWDAEWAALREDLDNLEEITVANAGRTFVMRSQTRGEAGRALQAAGVALGPVVRWADDTAGGAACSANDQA